MLIDDAYGYNYVFVKQKEFSFRGTIVVPFDKKHAYYAGYEEHDNLFFPVSFFTYNYLRHREDLDLNYFISFKQKQLNINLKDNNYCTIEDIKSIYLPDIKDPSKLAEDFPYVMYFHGFDDGSYFFRFKSKEEREDFFKIISNLSTANEIFFYEKENLVLFRDN